MPFHLYWGYITFLLSNATFRTWSTSSYTKPYPFQTLVNLLSPSLLLVSFPDLPTRSSLLLKTHSLAHSPLWPFQLWRAFTGTQVTPWVRQLTPGILSSQTSILPIPPQLGSFLDACCSLPSLWTLPPSPSSSLACVFWLHGSSTSSKLPCSDSSCFPLPATPLSSMSNQTSWVQICCLLVNAFELLALLSLFISQTFHPSSLSSQKQRKKWFKGIDFFFSFWVLSLKSQVNIKCFPTILPTSPIDLPSQYTRSLYHTFSVLFQSTLISVLPGATASFFVCFTQLLKTHICAFFIFPYAIKLQFHPISPPEWPLSSLSKTYRLPNTRSTFLSSSFLTSGRIWKK